MSTTRIRPRVLWKGRKPKGGRADVGPLGVRCAEEPREWRAARQCTPGCLDPTRQLDRSTRDARVTDRASRKEGRVHPGQVDGRKTTPLPTLGGPDRR